MNKTQLIADLATKVDVVLDSEGTGIDSGSADYASRLIPVLVTTEDATIRNKKGVLITYKTSDESDASYVGKVPENYVAPAAPDPADSLLAKFAAIEAVYGTVKVDPAMLERFGLKPFVFVDSNGVKRVQANVDGTDTVREAA